MSQHPQNPPALHAVDLLAAQPAEPDWSAGYLDLLGNRDQTGAAPGITQRLMRSELIATIYEDYWRPGLGRVMKGLRGPSMIGEVGLASERLELGKGDVALDIACGTGRFTRAFGSTVGRTGLAVGLDGSRPMLTEAVARTAEADNGHENVEYVRADAVSLPFADSTIDALCCFAALHLFDDAETALDSFARVLKPGGRIVLLTSGRRHHQPARLLETLGGCVSGLRMFDRGEIGELLVTRGFVDVVQDYAGVTQLVSARLIP